jgi:hypothetical protein
MNHKRRRPKHQRAGRLFCKPWKDERGTMTKGQGPNGHEKASVRRKLQDPVPRCN